MKRKDIILMRTRSIYHSLLASLGILSCTGSTGFTSAQAASEMLKEPVRLDTGLITGVAGKTPGVRVFKGIPYAAPPVGNLRWHATMPPAPWEGVRAMDHFSGMAIQSRQTPGSFYQIEYFPLPGPEATEDCLYLNVWTAAKSDQEKRPVMVWIHGGGAREGYGHEPVFDGEALARKGVVLVTINMRLGIFGFFAHPELTQESEHHCSGNYYHQDVIAALQWAQRNIRVFGGNPGNVTIFGQSSGGGTVAELMTISQAKGLFHRGIIQSQISSRLSYARTQLADLERSGVAFAEKLGAKSLRELRAIPSHTILSASLKHGFGPCIDGWWVKESHYGVFARGAQHPIPLLAGVTAKEMGDPYTRPKLEVYLDRLKRDYPKDAASFLKWYPASCDAESAVIFDSLVFEACLAHSRLPVRWQVNIGLPAYFYWFDRKPPKRSNEKNPPGAFHCAELPYVFNTLDSIERPWEETDRRLADQVSSYWVNFAATGNPNGPGLPVWPACKEKPDYYMELGDRVGVLDIPNKERLDFREEYFISLAPRPSQP